MTKKFCMNWEFESVRGLNNLYVKITYKWKKHGVKREEVRKVGIRLQNAELCLPN